MEMSPDKMVQDLLKILRERGVAALVVYASRAAAGGVPVRIVSNSDQRGAQGILSWLMKIEPAARDAAARAVHDTTTGRDLVDDAADPAEVLGLRPCLVCGTIEPWNNLGPEDKDRHVQVANIAIAAIKANTGRAPQAEMLPQ